jgi:hypothetical protein
MPEGMGGVHSSANTETADVPEAIQAILERIGLAEAFMATERFLHELNLCGGKARDRLSSEKVEGTQQEADEGRTRWLMSHVSLRFLVVPLLSRR